jgi:hypothetical protein
MLQWSSDWTCDGCGRDWTSQISYEGAESEDRPSAYEPVSCPGCGRGFLQLYQAEWKVWKIDVLPRATDR